MSIGFLQILQEEESLGIVWKKCSLVLEEKKKNATKKVIQLLESPIPAAPAPAVSQKAFSDDISGTKHGTIDPTGKKSE